ncbi:MAG TPA: hypothetical protein VFP25_02650 [Nitrososphaeraceae archaeon]|nr:hypothetical protein [Nitrososphaeraceae archaeon]
MEKKNCNFENKKKIIPRYAVSIIDNTILTSEIESWHKFSDCLRNKKELFEQMLQSCYKYSSSINAKGEDHSRVIAYDIIV